MIKTIKINSKGNLTLKKYFKKLDINPLDDVGVLITDINGIKSITISKGLLNFTDENKIIDGFTKTFLSQEQKMLDFLKKEVLNTEKLRQIFFKK